jgi:hypothetical protein
MRSLWDIIDYQEDNREILCFQEGNKMRSLWDLIDYQEDSEGISHCQEGNDMGSEDLIDCQVGSREIPYFQEVRGTKMRLYESLMNSEVSLDQPE